MTKFAFTQSPSYTKTNIENKVRDIKLSVFNTNGDCSTPTRLTKVKTCKIPAMDQIKHVYFFMALLL